MAKCRDERAGHVWLAWLLRRAFLFGSGGSALVVVGRVVQCRVVRTRAIGKGHRVGGWVTCTPRSSFRTPIETLRRVFIGLAGLTIGSVATAVPAQGVTSSPTVLPCVTTTCYVDVSVATLWAAPGIARPIDQLELANPTDPRRWVSSMTLEAKRWLVGRLETQALYGTRVTVIGRSDSAWLHVVVPSQTTNRDSRGYPGWVPARQLSSTEPSRAARIAIVRSPTAWLWSGRNAGGITGKPLMEVSFDTSFPVVAASPRSVEIALIGGRHAALRRGDVVVRGNGTTIALTPAMLVATARRFLGLQYLWAGTSGFGFDCSGFTFAIFRQYGVALARDADQQAVHGIAVASAALEPGDLVFFRASVHGPVTHVAMYVGSGEVIEAPGTGLPVRLALLSFGPDSRHTAIRLVLIFQGYGM